MDPDDAWHLSERRRNLSKTSRNSFILSLCLRSSIIIILDMTARPNQSTRERGGNRTKIIEISKSYEIFFLLVHTALECVTVIQMKFHCFYFHLPTHLERVCPSVSPSVDSPVCMHVSNALWYRTATSHQNHIFSQAWVYGSDWASERVSKAKSVSQRTSELSGARERSEQCRAIKWVMVVSKRTNEWPSVYVHPYSLLFKTSVERFLIRHGKKLQLLWNTTGDNSAALIRLLACSLTRSWAQEKKFHV